MYNRRDNALMQFKSYEQALNGTLLRLNLIKSLCSGSIVNPFSFLNVAVSKMDKVKLFDKVISVGMSKFPEIQIPIKNVNIVIFN